MKNRKEQIKILLRKKLYTKHISELTIEKIAKELGVSKSVIYYHFSCKEEILYNVVMDLIRDAWKFRLEENYQVTDLESFLECYYRLFDKSLDNPKDALLVINYLDILTTFQSSEYQKKILKEFEAPLKENETFFQHAMKNGYLPDLGLKLSYYRILRSAMENSVTKTILVGFLAGEFTKEDARQAYQLWLKDQFRLRA